MSLLLLLSGIASPPAPAPTPGPPAPPPPASAAEIADALAGRHQPVNLSYSFLRLDPVTFVATADLTTAVVEGSASISLDNSRPILRSASFDLLPAYLPADWAETDEVVGLYASLVIPGRLPQSWPLGIYQLDAPERQNRPNYVRTWNDVRAADLCYRLQTKTKSEAHTVLGGSSYVSAVNALVTDGGLQALIIDPGLTTPADFTWPPYTPYLVIINELLAGINFYPAWARLDGRITSRERIDPYLEVPTVAYTSEGEPRLIIGSGFPVRPRREGVQNRFVVTVQDPARPPAAATAVNIDGLSPVSVTVTGRPVTGQANGDRAADTTTLQAIARFEVRAAALQRLSATLSTVTDPRRDAHETYTVEIEDVSLAEAWRVQSWTMQLAEGKPMVHQLVHVDSIAVEVTST